MPDLDSNTSIVLVLGAHYESLFWAKVQKTNGCWLWTAAKINTGYGQFQIKRHHFLAHRISYMLSFGKIPDALEIDHLCRNRACVNPLHLETVTHYENILRGNGFMAIRAKQTHCQRGHSMQNAIIRKDGRRRCRTCVNKRQRQKYRERKNIL